MTTINEFNCITHEDIFLYTNEIEVTDDIIIENTILFLHNLNTEETVLAKFNCIVKGSMRGKKIIVKGDLFCFGDIECEVLEVSGKFTCLGHIQVDTLLCYSDIEVKSCTVEQRLVGEGSLLINSTLEINGELRVLNIICLEGIFGDGSIKADKIIAKEYCEVEEIAGLVIILDDGITIDKQEIEDMANVDKEEDKPSTSTTLTKICLGELMEGDNLTNRTLSEIKEIKTKLNTAIAKSESEFEFEDIKKVIAKIASYLDGYNEVLNIYDRILYYSNRANLDTISEYIELVELKAKTPDFLMQISLVEDTFNYLLDKHIKNINNLDIGNLTYSETLELLMRIEGCRIDIANEEYGILLNRIFKETKLSLDYINRYLDVVGCNVPEVDYKHRQIVEVLREEVPEIKQGLIQVKNIAGEDGYIKVAVTSYDSKTNPVRACIGVNGDRINKIVNRLGGEAISVVEWYSDITKFIRSALRVPEKYEIDLDHKENLAKIKVPSPMIPLLIGKDGRNIRLSSELTGWRLNIHETYQR